MVLGSEQGFQGADGLADLFLGVGARNKEAQARGFFRDGRVQDGLDVDAMIEQLGRKAGRLERAADDGGHDGQALAGAGVDASGAGLREELLSARLQGLHEVGHVLHAFERGEGGGGHGRRHADTVEEAGSEEFQMLDQGTFAGDIAATGGQGLAQCAHPDVDIAAVQPEVFADAVAAFAHYPQGVGFVDHEEAAVAPLDLDEAGQVRVVAIHAVDAFQHDEHALELMALLIEQVVERAPVVVRERQPPGAGELYALQNAVVDQFVVQDEVARAEEVADGRHIGGVAAHEGDGVIHAVQASDLDFQFAVDGALAGHQAAGRDRGAIAVDGTLGGFGDGQVAGHAQVVVAGVIDVGLAADARMVVGGAFMYLEEGILQAQLGRAIVQDAQLLVAGMQVKAIELFRDGLAVVRGKHRGACIGAGGRLAQLAFQCLLDQFVFESSSQAGRFGFDHDKEIGRGKPTDPRSQVARGSMACLGGY